MRRINAGYRALFHAAMRGASSMWRALGHHARMHFRDRKARCFLKRERKQRMHEACEARLQQRPAETACYHQVLGVRLAD